MKNKTTIEDIKEAYEIVFEYLDGRFPLNDHLTRLEIKDMFEMILEDKVDFVKCDLENNTPDVIDDGAIMVRLEYNTMPNGERNYIDLTLGKEVKWEHEMKE